MPYQDLYLGRKKNMEYCQKWRDKKRQMEGIARTRFPRYPQVLGPAGPAATSSFGREPLSATSGAGEARISSVPAARTVPTACQGGPPVQEFDVVGHGELQDEAGGEDDGNSIGGHTENWHGAGSDDVAMCPVPQTPLNFPDNGAGIHTESSSSDSSSEAETLADSEEDSAPAGSSALRERELRQEFNILYNDLITKHNLSEAGCQRVHNFIIRMSSEVASVQEQGLRIPKNVHHLRRTVKKKTPAIRTTVYMRKSDGFTAGGKHLETEYVQGDYDEVPSALSQNEGVRMASYAAMKDVVALAKKNHSGQGWSKEDYKYIDICLDGVPEGKSCPNKLIVFCVMWPKCETPYLYRVVSARYGCPPSAEALLVGFKEDLESCGMMVRYLRCDAVERHHLLNMIACTGLSGCDWCLEKGTRSFNPGVTVYPADRTTATGKQYSSCPRTHAGNLALADLAERTDGPEGECGVYGRSPLYELKNFDSVKSVVYEAMHGTYEGSTRRLMNGSLPTPGGQETVQRVRLNKILQMSKRWSEWPRAPRKLDIPRYKASDFFFFLMHVAPTLSLEKGVFREERNHRLMWAIFSFVARAAELPDEYFVKVDATLDLEALMHRLNEVVDEEFGYSETTYNIHITCRHLVENRRRVGPISRVGTWGPESLFKYVRSGFALGTRSVAKQVMENLNTQQLLNHRCLSKPRKLNYTSHTTRKTDDSLAATRQGKFFKIVKDMPNDTYLGYDIETIPFTTDHLGLGTLNWEDVGIARITDLKLPDLDEARKKNIELKVLSREDFIGKGVLIGRTISLAVEEWATLQMN